MKELIKPQEKSSDKDMVYEALDEGGCGVRIGCIECGRKGYSDEDQEDIVF